MYNLRTYLLLFATLFIGVVAFAYDFSEKSPSGQVLYYNYIQRDTLPYTVEIVPCPLGAHYEGDIIIPDTLTHNNKLCFVTSIAPHAFIKAYKLYSIELPNTLVSIGSSAFRDCIHLKSITFPEGLEYIGSYSLVNCVSLRSIGIPKNVSFIGTFAFGNCKGLANIYVDFDNEYYSSMAGILFNKAGNELIYYPSMREGESFEIPIIVNFIDDWAFCGALNLLSVYIPTSVVYIGKSAFWGCRNLVAIDIPNTVELIRSRTFYDCRKLEFANVSKSTRIVSTAFMPYTTINYTPKRNYELKPFKRPYRDPNTKRPTNLPEEIFAQYNLPNHDAPLFAEEKTISDSSQYVINAVEPNEINIEELIELQEISGGDLSNIVIANSPTGDDNDDVVPNKEIDELQWPIMDEELEYYLSNYEKGQEEKEEYLVVDDEKSKTHKKINKSNPKKKYTLFGNEI